MDGQARHPGGGGPAGRRVSRLLVSVGPVQTPRGSSEGKAAKRGRHTAVGSRQCGVPRASQGHGAPESPQLHALDVTGTERSHKVKARPLSCISCVPCPCPGSRWTSSASFPQRRGFNAEAQKEKVLHLKDPVPAGNQEIYNVRETLEACSGLGAVRTLGVQSR